ncbi:acetyl-CoA carboxylase, carboxyltransferase subunit beta [Bdellovibrionota bacterium FG-2]
MTWFDDLKTPRIKSTLSHRPSKIPEGMWEKCVRCGEIIQTKVLREALQVCPECGFHFRITAWERVSLLCDDGKFKEYAQDLTSNDPLKFDDLKPYRDRLGSAVSSTGLKESVISGKAELSDLSYHLAVFDFRFLGGSMGVVAGEKVTQVFEKALKEKLPAVIVTASGGARMQEGILSLMQMAKTTALVHELKKARIPYVSILTDPTTGGVAASFAMLGDVILAEPAALIGFAGPRVVEQTIRQALPEGFQRSEFLLQHGFLDRVVARKFLATELRQILGILGRKSCRPSRVTEDS